MKTPKTSVVPPGGYHFYETHDGLRVKIESDSYEALSAALLRYRINNGIPPGNPQQDVFDYVCNTWPHYCHDNDPYNKLVGREPSMGEMLSRRVVVWMTKLWNAGASNEVKNEEAERRAAICATCPLNVDYKAGGCGACLDGVERLAFTWLRTRKTTRDKELKACSATGALNRCAVQAQSLPPMSAEQQVALHPNCWRK